jgi:hypothetical protein
MTPLAKRVIQQIVRIAHRAHTVLRSRGAYDDTFPFETPAKIFQRMLNSVMSDRSGSKTGIAYFIGNQLFRCYFKVPNSPFPQITPPLVGGLRCFSGGLC